MSGNNIEGLLMLILVVLFLGLAICAGLLAEIREEIKGRIAKLPPAQKEDWR